MWEWRFDSNSGVVYCTVNMEHVTVITSDFVNVYITTPDNTAQCLATKRFKKDLTVADLKVSLYRIIL